MLYPLFSLPSLPSPSNNIPILRHPPDSEMGRSSVGLQGEEKMRMDEPLAILYQPMNLNFEKSLGRKSVQDANTQIEYLAF